MKRFRSRAASDDMPLSHSGIGSEGEREAARRLLTAFGGGGGGGFFFGAAFALVTLGGAIWAFLGGILVDEDFLAIEVLPRLCNAREEPGI